MHCFGLTGGIASGKSAVAKIFAERGVAIVDADQVAREVVRPGTEGLRAVVARFGDVLATDGSLDRKALGAKVFASESERRALEAITHPLIRARTMELLAGIAAKGIPLACYEAALLVESGAADLFRPVVLVTASAATRTLRIRNRDGLGEGEAADRMKAQWDDEAKRKLADHVIENDGTLEELRERTLAVLDIVARQFSSP